MHGCSMHKSCLVPMNRAENLDKLNLLLPQVPKQPWQEQFAWSFLSLLSNFFLRGKLDCIKR